MLVEPAATRDSTARLAAAFPSPDMRVSRTTRRASSDMATTQRRSRGPRLSTTNPMPRFTSSSLGPAMLPLTSSTATRSRGVLPAACEGALTCTITAKPSCAALLGIDGYFFFLEYARSVSMY